MLPYLLAILFRFTIINKFAIKFAIACTVRLRGTS